MGDYGTRIVVDKRIDPVIDILSDAMRAEGMVPLAQINVREQFARELSRDFRRYVLIQGWSPQLAMDALRHNLDAGTVLPVSIAVYELGDGETTVVANSSFAPVVDDHQWRTTFPVLAALADRETEKLARVIDRIAHGAVRHVA
jgi:uncharacterized protein (DUF302 family)